MKTTGFCSKKVSVVLLCFIVFCFAPSCIVLSFYPLYDKGDLFVNNMLEGVWLNEDSTAWVFAHSYKMVEGQKVCDSLRYDLKLHLKNGVTENSCFDVRILKHEEAYFLDFFLDDYDPIDKERYDFVLFDLHMVPVHSFARLMYWEDSISIEWFDADWLGEKIKRGEITEGFVDNGESFLLTMQTKELKELFFCNYEDHVYSIDEKLYRSK